MVFPSPTLARNVFGSNAAFLLFFTKKSSSPDEARSHVRQSGINSGNHTAIPTPKINILAGVTLTHFTLCALP
jgi:hypothetical protein